VPVVFLLYRAFLNHIFLTALFQQSRDEVGTSLT
jgi:hypothetical protein